MNSAELKSDDVKFPVYVTCGNQPCLRTCVNVASFLDDYIEDDAPVWSLGLWRSELSVPMHFRCRRFKLK